MGRSRGVKNHMDGLTRARNYVAAVIGGTPPQKAYADAMGWPETDVRRNNCEHLVRTYTEKARVQKLFENSRNAVLGGELDSDRMKRHKENLDKIAFDESVAENTRVAASVAALKEMGAFAKEESQNTHITINLTRFDGNNQINAGPCDPDLEKGERHFAVPLSAKAVPSQVLAGPGAGSEETRPSQPPA